MTRVLSRRALARLSLGGALLLASRVARADGATPPVLYVSHGSPLYLPMNASRVADMRAWGARLSSPRGIVVVTPHFAARDLAIGAIGPGFAMYNLPGAIKRRLPENLDYATPTNETLAARVTDALAPRYRVTRTSDRRGFDHTTWMPLSCLFPRAESPVVELTYPYWSDADLFSLGRSLAPLRREGVMIVASGGMTHNLASMDLSHESPGAVPSWSREFDAWSAETLASRNADALIDWRKKAPAAELAHPDDGAHFRVLLIALGAAIEGATQISFPIEGFESTLSIRSAQLDA